MIYKNDFKLLNCKNLTRCLQYFRRKYCNEHAQTSPPDAT
jgi:hypothetical protein